MSHFRWLRSSLLELLLVNCNVLHYVHSDDAQRTMTPTFYTKRADDVINHISCLHWSVWYKSGGDWPFCPPSSSFQLHQQVLIYLYI